MNWMTNVKGVVVVMNKQRVITQLLNTKSGELLSVCCINCRLNVSIFVVVVNSSLICKSRQWWSNMNHNPFPSLISHLKCCPLHILVRCLAAVWYFLLPAGCHTFSYFSKSKPSTAQLTIRHPSAGLFFHPVLNNNCRQLRQCFYLLLNTTHNTILKNM